MLIRSLIIVVLCIVTFRNLDGQRHYKRFDHLTTLDGLSSNRIWCIFRDSRDYLWIGTDVGLDRYDSYEFKKFRYNESQPGSISSDNILCIYEDSRKEMWFGTSNGLNLYSRTKNTFKVFRNNPADKKSLNGNLVHSILEDKAGNLWVITDGDCLNKWVPETQSFIRYQYDVPKDLLYPRTSRMIAEDSKGTIWLVSLGRGIFKFEPASEKFTKYEDPLIDLGNNCFKHLLIDKQDKIWITTDGNGFFSFDPETKKFEQYGSDGDGKGTNRKMILDIIEEDDRFLLLAVDQGGINRFDKVTRRFEYFMYGQTGENGLNHNGIWCFHKDKDDILWVGTSGGGISYYNSKSNRFQLYTHSTDNPKSLSFSLSTCFYEDYQGKIWIGTDGGGVNVLDPKTSIFQVYKHDPSDPTSISGDVIRSISGDSSGNIWIGTWDAGLNRFDRKTGKFIRYAHDPNNPSTLSSPNIWILTVDHTNVLWVSIFSIGTDLFDKSKGVIGRFRADPGNKSAISSNSCWLYYEDPKQNMWICTEDGLNVFDRRTSSFRVYDFPDKAISAICVDRQGNLWVGSNKYGVYYCKPDGSVIQNFDNTNGLPGNRIHAIIEDNNGNMWFSTSNGISCYNIKTKKFRNYFKSDGLQGDQFFQQSFLKARDGKIYFGGYNGFNSFYPDSLKDNDYIPPVYITDFQIFNKQVTTLTNGSQFPVEISEAKEIKLNWHQSVISFSFAAINYTYPGKNQYAYIMEGFEKEWNYTDASRRYITYTNLDPGEYTLRIRASNNDNVWNEKGTSLKIIILPPWWKTLFFKLSALIALILLVMLFVMFRVRTLKNQKNLLEKLVAAKTAELVENNIKLIEQAEKLSQSNRLLEEHQLKIEKQSSELFSQKEKLEMMNTELNELVASKDRFFSIIAHDLKNPFNVIIGFSELLKEVISKGEYDSCDTYANMIHESAVKTLALLENLLEWAKSKSGKISFKPVNIILSDVIREELNVLNDIAGTKNIEIKLSVSDDIVVYADRNMLKTILRNLMSNSIKFTPKNGKVEINAMAVNSTIEISIADNGVGMSHETVAKLFRIDSNLSTPGTENEKGTGLGLLLSKEFMEKHKGKISVESEPGKGSIFRLSFPVV
jgi:signal transduction histidine kinase/ligand-binding sensor domain-containing protein